MVVIMDDTEQLRQIAASIIEKSHDDSAVQKAAELLKIAGEIDRQKAEAGKLAAEELKINDDLKDSQQVRKHTLVKDYISLLAPLFTTVVLAGTLVQQSYQFVQSEKTKQAQFIQAERDKDAEARRQADAAEDLRWAEAVKLLSSSEKLSPAGVILKSFIKSERYGGASSETAMQVLLKTKDPDLFSNLFTTLFDPVSWTNILQIIDLNRTQHSEASLLYTKTWNPKTFRNDLGKLNAAELQKWQYLKKDRDVVCTRIASLLKGSRPPGTKLDLGNADLDGNFEGADFSGANVEGAVMTGINIKGAKLNGLSGYENTSFEATAWWQASTIDQGLLEYLIRKYPYNNQAVYSGATGQADYEAGVARLRQSLTR